MTKAIDWLMKNLYCSSISLLDVFVIITLSMLDGWYWLLIVPWLFYSSMQKIKYDQTNHS